MIDHIRPGQKFEVRKQLCEKGRVFFELANNRGFIPQFSRNDPAKMVVQIQGDEACTPPTKKRQSRTSPASCNKRPKNVQARVAYEITLSSPDALAAEEFEQSNLIYDDSGEFDADISGMLCELPYPSSWSAGMHVESGRQCDAWRMNKQISEEPQCVS